MTRKEVHNILDQPRRLAIRIKRLTEEREALIGGLMPGGMDMNDRIQKSPEDVMAKVMAEVADIDEEIERLTEKRADELIRLRRMLDGDDVKLAIVSMSYIGSVPMRVIAEELHYALSTVYWMRAEGLDEVGERLEKLEGDV